MENAQEFALDVWNARGYLERYARARNMWRCAADLEDGIQETILRALEGAARFDARRSARKTWITSIMWRVRSGQLKKGHNKNKPLADCAARVVYTDAADYADHIIERCDPEGILMALEAHRAW
jgi:DNA-directed RNA polymerase specialized sigma24 family protein